jgi:hypothetical protein
VTPVAAAAVVGFTIGDLAELQDAGIDACTLNNALNVAQLVVLVVLLRWVRGGAS